MWPVISNIKHFHKHLIVRSGQCEIPDLGLSFNEMSLLSKLCKLTRFGRVQFWTCSVGAPTQCKVSGSTVIIVTTVSLSFERWGGEPGNGHAVIYHKARNVNLVYMHILMFVRSIFQFLGIIIFVCLTYCCPSEFFVWMPLILINTLAMRRTSWVASVHRTTLQSHWSVVLWTQVRTDDFKGVVFRLLASLFASIYLCGVSCSLFACFLILLSPL